MFSNMVSAKIIDVDKNYKPYLLDTFNAVNRPLIIPIIYKGKMVNVQARGHAKYLKANRSAMKYKNMWGAKTYFYNKDALDGMKAGDTLYIVEGSTDAMRLAQEGYNAIATMGGIGKIDMLFMELIADFKIIIVPDTDDTGRVGAESVARIASTYQKYKHKKVMLKVLKLPKGIKDVCEYYQHYH